MEFLDIVNKQDKIIGEVSREDIYKRTLLHRIVHIFVFNDKGQLALQLRGKNVSFVPLHWGTAGGHVQSGESYEQAAKREADEEIGVITEMNFKFKDYYEDDEKKVKKFLASFETKFNGPFKINPREVERVKFFSLDEIKNMVKRREKLHPEFLFLLKKHFNIG